MAVREGRHLHERKGWGEMIGESLHEIGALYLLFGFLYAQVLRLSGHATSVTAWWYAGVTATSVLILFVGMVVERVRR